MKNIFRNNKFKKNRKGLVSDVMLGILAVATILVLIMFAYGLYGYFKEKMSIQNCKSSIEAHSAVSKWTAREIFTDIKCPTNEITIKNNNKAKEILAEDMHRCWYIWGQGKGMYFKGEGSYCHVCGIYQFGDKGQEIEGFMEYIRTQPIKVKYDGDTPRISYQDYFAGYTTPQSASMIDKKIESTNEFDVLNTSKKYATIFVYASGKDAVSVVLEGQKAALSATGGILIIGGTAATVAGVSGIAVSLGAAAIAGTLNAWNPVGWVILAGVGVVGIGVGAVSIYTAIFAAKEPEWMAFVAFREYNTETLNKLGCDKLYVNQMSNAGKP